MGTQRTRSALFRSNLRDSHLLTDGIATDNCRKYTKFSFIQWEIVILPHYRHCNPIAKVKVWVKTSVVHFSTCLSKKKRINPHELSAGATRSNISAFRPTYRFHRPISFSIPALECRQSVYDKTANRNKS